MRCSISSAGRRRSTCSSRCGNGSRENEAIPYNLSCYACQFGDLVLAMHWFQAAEKISDSEKIREVALLDPDLEPIWEQISK